MDVSLFYKALIKAKIDFFSGVPDSLLKSFCAYVQDNHPSLSHVLAANEGNAMGLASGHYLATGKPALIYLQNSGLGNCINPLLSILDEAVYNIPVLMLIGYRGEPGIKDEPQHVKQGELSLPLLKCMGISYKVLDSQDNNLDINEVVSIANEYMKKTNKPYALVVKKGFFDVYKLQNKTVNNYNLSREDAIKMIVNHLKTEVVVSTTGMTSRELFEYREEQNQGHEKDFLTVGGMGHASQIALGIALSKPQQKVVCLDGDGAMLMHLGSLTINASFNPNNFKHILLNNGAHDSVGAQPTIGFDIDFCNLAQAAGYKKVYSVETEKDLENILEEFLNLDELALLEIKVKTGARSDLGRPTTTPIENKNSIMKFIISNKHE